MRKVEGQHENVCFGKEKAICLTAVVADRAAGERSVLGSASFERHLALRLDALLFPTYTVAVFT